MEMLTCLGFYMCKTASVLHYTLMYVGQSLFTLTCLRYAILMLAITIFCVMNKNIKHCFENKFQRVENLSTACSTCSGKVLFITQRYYTIVVINAFNTY